MTTAEGRTVIATTCAYCGVGCGLTVEGDEASRFHVRGDEAHPANAGRICSKGAALGETVDLDGRLLRPMVDGKTVGWDEALQRVADRFADTIARHGPDSVAFYVSGQLLTEDYYVANKLMKGFIGSANIDTNSRLCMASSVAGHKRAFGADTVPGVYADVELADLVILVGSNLAWCHPVLFQRLMSAKAARPELAIVAIDPRRTLTARSADLHLPLKPGSDVALFNGLLSFLARSGKTDADYVGRHTSGGDMAIACAEELDETRIAEITGLTVVQLRQFYDLFAARERTVSVYSQGVNQSSSGTNKVNAIINCHLLTGRIGRPGMGPFSVTGQPNAMGGREVGGLANQLACHMDLDNPEHRRIVADYWRAPSLATRPGLKAVDLFRAIGEGRVKAIWIAGTNPVDSLPDAGAVEAALAACPFVVVSDVLLDTDTTRHADVLLPAAPWGEKDGTVTNSERRISRQRAFLPLAGEARPDWWIFAEVAKRMGWADSFDYRHPSQILAEYACLSGKENDGRRDFDISALSNVTPDQYDALAPFQWPWPSGAPRPTGDQRFFADGGFYTADRRARFIATPWREAAEPVNDRLQLILNTGRVRDQWHTMTRTGRSPRLMGHIAEPFVEIHPDDAAATGLEPASLAVVENSRGRAVLRVLVNGDQQPGTVFAPIHWTDQFASQARIDVLVNPSTDPVSGQPELKYTAVSVRPFSAGWFGFAALLAKPDVVGADYWALARVRHGWRLELAGTEAPEDWSIFALGLFGATDDEGVELLAYHDAHAQQYRFAAFRGSNLIGVLFVASLPVQASRAWAADQLANDFTSSTARMRLLAGRAVAAQPDRGAIVCACFDVGTNQIAAAVAGGCASVDAVGKAVQAGTNCGSCRSEVQRIIDGTRIQKAS